MWDILRRKWTMTKKLLLCSAAATAVLLGLHNMMQEAAVLLQLCT